MMQFARSFLGVLIFAHGNCKRCISNVGRKYEYTKTPSSLWEIASSLGIFAGRVPQRGSKKEQQSCGKKHIPSICVDGISRGDLFAERAREPPVHTGCTLWDKHNLLQHTSTRTLFLQNFHLASCLLIDSCSQLATAKKISIFSGVSWQLNLAIFNRRFVILYQLAASADPRGYSQDVQFDSARQRNVPVFIQARISVNGKNRVESTIGFR